MAEVMDLGEPRVLNAMVKDINPMLVEVDINEFERLFRRLSIFLS